MNARAAVTVAVVVVAIAAVGRGSARADAAPGGDWGQNRAMGGAGVAVVADSSAIEVNPAGLTLFRRYTLGGMYAYATTGWLMGVAVADSKTSPLAMGLDYRHQRPFDGDEVIFGERKRHDLTVALGEYYLQRANFGLGYTWSKWTPAATDATETRHNVHAGLIVPVNKMLRLGAAFYEFVPFDDHRRDPRGDVGLAFSPHRVIVFAVDGIWHWSQGAEDWDAVAGVEAVARDQLGLRAGYRHAFHGGPRTWSAGLGWFFPKGQLAYAFNTEPGDRRFRHSASFEMNIL